MQAEVVKYQVCCFDVYVSGKLLLSQILALNGGKKTQEKSCLLNVLGTNFFSSQMIIEFSLLPSESVTTQQIATTKVIILTKSCTFSLKISYLIVWK